MLSHPVKVIEGRKAERNNVRGKRLPAPAASTITYHQEEVRGDNPDILHP
jgi:hypothetical protein